jgi:hypothetical protein
MATSAEIRDLAIRNVGGIERAERMVRVDPQAWTLQFEKARQQLQGGAAPQTFDTPFLPDITTSQAGQAISDAFPLQNLGEQFFGGEGFTGVGPGDEVIPFDPDAVSRRTPPATPDIPAPVTQQIPSTLVDAVQTPGKSVFGAQALGLDPTALTPPEAPVGPVEGPLTTPTEDTGAVSAGPGPAAAEAGATKGDLALGTSLLGLGIGQAQEGTGAVSRLESIGGIVTSFSSIAAFTGNSPLAAGLAATGTLLNMIGQRQSAAANRDFKVEFSESLASALKGAKSISG